MPGVLGKLIRPIRTINFLGAIPPASEEDPDTPPTYGGDYAIDLDGSADYMNVGDITVLDGLTAITIEEWVYCHSNGTMNFFSKAYNNLNCFNCYAIAGTSYPKLRIQANSVGGNNNNYGFFQTTGDALTLNTWHHVEMNLDLSTEVAYIFVDGVAKAGTHTRSAGGYPASLLNTSAPVNIGVGASSAGLNYFWNGYLGPTAVWNSVKHTAGFTPPTEYYVGNESGLVFYTPIWEGSGDTINELVNGHDGTGVSFAEAWWVTGPGLVLP